MTAAASQIFWAARLVMSFLFCWKQSPKPKSSVSPFKDALTPAYKTAIIWAAEKGITKGFSDNTFRDKQYCTRGEIVTFLYRVKWFSNAGRRSRSWVRHGLMANNIWKKSRGSPSLFITLFAHVITRNILRIRRHLNSRIRNDEFTLAIMMPRCPDISSAQIPACRCTRP